LGKQGQLRKSFRKRAMPMVRKKRMRDMRKTSGIQWLEHVHTPFMMLLHSHSVALLKVQPWMTTSGVVVATVVVVVMLALSGDGEVVVVLSGCGLHTQCGKLGCKHTHKVKVKVK
jgi:hypothetical protein